MVLILMGGAVVKHKRTMDERTIDVLIELTQRIHFLASISFYYSIDYFRTSKMLIVFSPGRFLTNIILLYFYCLTLATRHSKIEVCENKPVTQ